MSHPSFASEPINFEDANEEKEYRILLSRGFAFYPEQCEKALGIFSQMDQRWPYDPQVLGWLGIVHQGYVGRVHRRGTPETYGKSKAGRSSSGKALCS